MTYDKIELAGQLAACQTATWIFGIIAALSMRLTSYFQRKRDTAKWGFEKEYHSNSYNATFVIAIISAILFAVCCASASKLAAILEAIQ